MRRAIEERVLLLDGAMGTEIQRRGLSEADFRGDFIGDEMPRQKGNNDLLVLTRPDVIADIHRSYLEAGADIITTCTFNAQRISQADYATESLVGRINREAARLARRVADEFGPGHFVAGSMGPTGRLLTLEPEDSDVGFDFMESAYLEQAVALIEGGVDALLIETVVDTLNAKAAISAAFKAMEATGRRVEIMVSATLSDTGRTLSGQTLEAFVTSVMHARPLSIGLNCSFGAAGLLPGLRTLAKACPVAVSVHPNAGLPNAEGGYDATPESMAREMRPFVEEELANIIGGCCGTTPAHIAALRNLIDSTQHVRRQRRSTAGTLCLSGLEAMEAKDRFVNVGERCNVAGSRKFLRLIGEGAIGEALAIARRQVEDGAMALDINMDDGLLDARREMTHFVRALATDSVTAAVPLMIDSSDFTVIEEALKVIQGKAIVNSLSLKEGEEAFIEHARTVRRLGAALVVMAFDEEGQATDFVRKTEICRRAYKLLLGKAGFSPEDIVFDPNILTVATGIAQHANYAADYVDATRWIHTTLPGCRVSGGLSNLSFAFRGNNALREAMHAVFLYHAVQAGLNMAIMNPATTVPYDEVDPTLRDAIYDVLFGHRDAAATERLTAMAAAMATPAAKTTDKPSAPKRATDPFTALREAVIHADDSSLNADLERALATGATPLNIISGCLMEGLDEVGRRFGEGRMFLPQVVKTARTMRRAVEILEPLMEAGSAAEATAGAHSVVIATVKGDVHDIGKNIVAIILRCNGFRVIDLGVMVTPEDIVNAVQREKPDFVALSGLITPSLGEMAATIRSLADAGLDTPVMIGGATTSETHTAVALAPLTSAPVIHVRDASQNPIVAHRLLDADRRDAYLQELRRTQQALRNARQGAEKAAPANSRPHFAHPTKKPPFIGVRTLEPMSPASLRDAIDWRYFSHAWRVKPGSSEEKALLADAQRMLDAIAAEPDIAVYARLGFLAAHSTTDAIVFDDSLTAIATPRQDSSHAEPLALSDFVAPQADYVGVFAVAVSPQFVVRLEELKRGNDEYSALLMQTLGDRLAEAAAATLHARVQENAGWKGIRPAVGYPSLPDQSAIFALNSLADLSGIGIRLTENGAMYPQASVAGFIIGHPEARYFSVK